MDISANVSLDFSLFLYHSVLLKANRVFNSVSYVCFAVNLLLKSGVEAAL